MPPLLSSLFTAFCLLSGPVFIYCEINAKNFSQGTNALVIKIRERYSQINRSSSIYRQVKKDVPSDSPEGAGMIAFFSGKQIMKIAVTYYYESGRENVEYYFWEGKLIFVYKRDSHYDVPMSGRVVSVKENRCYFDEGRLIKWLDGKKERDVSNKNAEDIRTEFLDGAKEFVELANSNNSP